MLKDLSFLSLQVKQLEKILSKYEIMEKFMNLFAVKDDEIF